MPGGARGVLLYANWPNTCAYAERLGLMRDARNRFSVMSAWGRSLSQRDIGNSGSVVQSPAIKWFFSVRIARSAAFARCTPGGTSCIWMLLFAIKSCNIVEHSLSKRCSCGRRPARTRVLWIVL